MSVLDLEEESRHAQWLEQEPEWGQLQEPGLVRVRQQGLVPGRCLQAGSLETEQ